MKKSLILLFVFYLLSASLYSQAIQYEIKVKYARNTAVAEGDISVTVKSGEPEFTYFLMTNDPIKGEVLLKSEPTRSKNHVFKGVKPGKYFIRIEDRMGLPAGRTVEIKENDDSSN